MSFHPKLFFQIGGVTYRSARTSGKASIDPQIRSPVQLFSSKCLVMARFGYNTTSHKASFALTFFNCSLPCYQSFVLCSSLSSTVSTTISPYLSPHTY